MTAVVELFDQIFFEAIKRDHPVLLCVESLSRCSLYSGSRRSEPHTPVTAFRLPSELVSAATDFFDAMDALGLRQTNRRVIPTCGICGSDLCFTYAYGFTSAMSLAKLLSGLLSEVCNTTKPKG